MAEDFDSRTLVEVSVKGNNPDGCFSKEQLREIADNIEVTVDFSGAKPRVCVSTQADNIAVLDDDGCIIVPQTLYGKECTVSPIQPPDVEEGEEIPNVEATITFPTGTDPNKLFLGLLDTGEAEFDQIRIMNIDSTTGIITYSISGLKSALEICQHWAQPPSPDA